MHATPPLAIVPNCPLAEWPVQPIAPNVANRWASSRRVRVASPAPPQLCQLSAHGANYVHARQTL
eukprot:11816073-Alexandrium_andersonii.AAC.1